MTEYKEPLRKPISDLCKKCPLGQGKKPEEIRFVPTESHAKGKRLKILFCGEAPGAEEQLARRPFVGKSGKLLRDIIKNNVDTSRIGFSNVVRCRPTEVVEGKYGNEMTVNRAPTQEESETCRAHLLEDIKRLNPKMVVMLGKVPTSHSAGSKKLITGSSITRARGQVIEYGGRKYLPTLHPAYILRQRTEEIKLVNDIRQANAIVTGKEASKYSNKGKSVHLKTYADIKKYLNYIRYEHKGPVAFDIETENVYRLAPNRILSIQLATDVDTGYIIALEYKHWQYESGKVFRKIVKLLKETIRNAKYVTAWIGHNCKFDIDKLYTRYGIKKWSAPVVDTAFMAHLLDDNRARDKSNEAGGGTIGDGYKLKVLSPDWLMFNHYDEEAKILRNAGDMEGMTYVQFMDYSGMDGYVTLRLYYYILEEAAKQHYKNKLLTMAIKWGSRMTEMIPAMERWGIHVDRNQLLLLLSDKSPIKTRLDEISREMRKDPNVKKANKRLLQKDYRTSGMVPLFGVKQDPWLFNPSKKSHLLILFFDILGLKPLAVGKPTKEWPKGEPSLDKAEFFKQYAPDDDKDGNRTVPLVALEKERRTLDRLRTNYANNIKTFLDKHPDCKDGRVHASFSIINTVTGRFACQDPPIQAMPRCLVGSTLIQTNHGIKTIGEIVDQKLHIGLPVGNDIKDHFKYTTKETIKVITRKGYSIEGTKQHRISVLTKEFEIIDRKLEDLEKTDHLLININNKTAGKQFRINKIKEETDANGNLTCKICGAKMRSLIGHIVKIHKISGKEYKEKYDVHSVNPTTIYPTKVPEFVTPELARILGYLVSEGYVSRKNEITFHNKDKALINDYIYCIEKCFGWKLKARLGKGKCHVVYFSSAYVRKLFVNIGLGYKKARGKRIPSCILQSPRDVIINYLSAYIAGDGSVYRNCVRMYTTSDNMVNEIQSLLLSIGYLSSIHPKTEADLNRIVLDGYDARRFINEMVMLRPKWRKVKHSNEQENGNGGGTCHTIPFIKRIMRNGIWSNAFRTGLVGYSVIKDRKQIKLPFIGDVFSKHRESSGFTLNMIENNKGIIEALELVDPEKAKILKKLIKNKLIPIQINSIKNIKHKKSIDVYDIETVTHHYVANGLVSHNSDSPAKSEIKSMYRAAIGRILIEGDYEQAEIRWWAQISGDKIFARKFLEMKKLKAQLLNDPNNEQLRARVKSECDIHRQVASSMFGAPILLVTADQRQAAKGLAFGAMYGQAASTLAAILGKPEKEAQKYQRKFIMAFPQAGKWLTDIEHKTRQLGYVESPLFRRRRMSHLYDSGNPGMIAEADRRARNSPIQAVSADTTALSAWLMYRYIQENKKDWKVIDVVHDSILMEVPLNYNEMKECLMVLERIMTKEVFELIEKDFGYKVFVPFSADFKVGLRLGMMQKGDNIKKTYKEMKKYHKKEVRTGWMKEAA